MHQIPNTGSRKYNIIPAMLPYLTPLYAKFPVTMYASNNNVTLEDNDVIRINPQLSSRGENEFVVPLTVAIIDTNGTHLMTYCLPIICIVYCSIYMFRLTSSYS